MFDVGNIVVYESLGVCKVVDIRSEKFPSMKKAMYYVLETVYGTKTTVYAPVDNESLRIRSVMSAEQAKELVRAMPDQPLIWADNENERRELFSSIIRTGNREQLIGMIHSLYSNRNDQLAAGRKFHASDAKQMSDAEKLLYEELAYALGIEPDEVLDVISSSIGDQKSVDVFTDEE